MKVELNLHTVVIAGLLVMLLLLPVYSTMTGDRFVMTLFTRIVILALAAVSLNLLLGYGGMVSFGHAAYLGIGGYAVGMMARGVYFIMITLAFAQMAYYIAAGLARYGGDDGLTLQRRSDFAGLINLSNKVQFYYLCVALLFGAIYLVWRLINSRFGLAIQGARSNEVRMGAIGFPVYRYKLACFVIAGTMCGLAGVLLANNTDFVSPAMMFWTRSGDLIVMVVLGGMGSLFGPLFGALALLLLEQFLPFLLSSAVKPFYPAVAAQAGEYWQIVLGPLLLLVVLYARGGIDGLLKQVSRG
jgi:branched-chain amino acid transport system permease protein